MAVHSFIDSSGIELDSYVSLAAFVADDSTWGEFGEGWREVLKSGYRPVPYMHMKEAVHRNRGTPFCYSDGWTREHVWNLILKLAEYMNSFRDGRLTMHSCVVDMNAWRELIKQGINIPSAIELCNRRVLGTIVLLFGNNIKQAATSWPVYLQSDHLLSFVFDRHEAFISAFRKMANDGRENAERCNEFSLWQLVGSIAEGKARATPGLQAADILAWGINRENTLAEGKQGRYLAYILRQLVMNTSKEYDRETLLQEFGPPLRTCIPDS